VVTAPPSGRQTVPNVTKYNYFDTGPVQRSDHRVARAAKSYEYTPDGMRLSQTTHNSDGSTSNGYYTYNDHADVEVVTGSGGNTKSTYQYTAYGQDDKTQFTGADKNPPQNGTEPFNPYRYNAMRWDSSAAQYDMGFRDYDPGLNQFLSRDMYNGALDDMDLDTDPFTGNRYTFGGGNPVTNIELDGHMFPGGAGCTSNCGTQQNSTSAMPTCPIVMLICVGAFSGIFGSRWSTGTGVLNPPKPAPPGTGQNPPASRDWGWLRWASLLAAAAAAAIPNKVNTQDRARRCFESGASPEYGPLDKSGGATLGRATWAEACLQLPIKPGSEYDPDYPGFDPNTMDRAHLLAKVWGGTGGRKNRVVFWRMANQGEGTDPLQMHKVELDIQAELDRRERVYYFAQAVYVPGQSGDPYAYMPLGIKITWGTAESGLHPVYIPNIR
jgi:RHS repeat-associated protein